MKYVLLIAATALVVGGVTVANGASGKRESASVAKTKRGPRGPRGPQGPQGPKGDPGVTGYTDVFESANVPNGEIVTIRATCPAGYAVTGGGFGNGANDIVYANSTDDQTYEVAVGNFSSLSTASASAQAFCVRGLTSTTATRANRLSLLERQTLITEAKAAHR